MYSRSGFRRRSTRFFVYSVSLYPSRCRYADGEVPDGICCVKNLPRADALGSKNLILFYCTLDGVRFSFTMLFAVHFLQLGQFTQFADGEEAADDRGGGIRNGAGVHDTVDAEEDREDDDQRKQEQNLTCQ